jgi:hypothetical protein
VRQLFLWFFVWFLFLKDSVPFPPFRIISVTNPVSVVFPSKMNTFSRFTFSYTLHMLQSRYFCLQVFRWGCHSFIKISRWDDQYEMNELAIYACCYKRLSLVLLHR